MTRRHHDPSERPGDPPRSDAALLELLAESGPVPEPPADLERRVLAAVEDAATAPVATLRQPVGDPPERAARPERRPRGRRSRGRYVRAIPLRFALPGVVALTTALLVVLLVRPDAPGTLEAQATLRAPSGAKLSVQVFLEQAPEESERTIDLRARALPALAEDEIYQLWFIGSDDPSLASDRLPATTFRPDARGDLAAQLPAETAPRGYRGFALTAEPLDGSRTGKALSPLRLPTKEYLLEGMATR